MLNDSGRRISSEHGSSMMSASGGASMMSASGGGGTRFDASRGFAASTDSFSRSQNDFVTGTTSHQGLLDG